MSGIPRLAGDFPFTSVLLQMFYTTIMTFSLVVNGLVSAVEHEYVGSQEWMM
jgi:hypothetical protein